MLTAFEIHNFKGLHSVTLNDCGAINALIGKNNSGKSSVLHALDMAGLALSVSTWDAFQPKLEIEDLIANTGGFELALTYRDGRKVVVRTDERFSPRFAPGPDDAQKFKTVLILPDPALGLTRRGHKTPRTVVDQLEARNFGDLTSMEILFAIRYYAERRERSFSPETYTRLIERVKDYFPELESIEIDRTENDISTLTYNEYGRKLDILYSGTGLRHFLDILLKITLSGARVVLLDEPELGLHPDLQRRFMGYLRNLTEKQKIQVFMATHSPIVLTHADTVTFFRVLNTRGTRSVSRVPADGLHTLMSDLGIRPSDVFNQDMCILVEGASEVIFFEHVIRTLYKTEFDKLAVGIIQYGGGAAEGIISGAIDIRNISAAQKYTLWTHDRDAKPEDPPSSAATKFRNKIVAAGHVCEIWKKREIEFYYPEDVHIAAQQGDSIRADATRAILHGDQAKKYRTSAAESGLGICVPAGKNLKKLLSERLTSIAQLDPEMRRLVEEVLLPWRNEITGL